MNSLQKKQKRELEQTKAFLEIAKIDYLEIDIIPEGNDPPDIVITTTKSHRIGIEHTMLTKPKGDKIKQTYDTFDNVIEEARKKFEKEYNIPLIVHFDFAAKLDTRKGNKINIINEIFTLIASNLPEINGSLPITNNLINRNLLPNYINSINIIWNKDNNEMRWKRYMDLIWSGELPLDFLNSKIEDKNKILLDKKYNVDYDESWLLMIAEGTHWSEFSSYYPKNFKVSPFWKFDRIYIFGMFESKIERLK